MKVSSMLSWGRAMIWRGLKMAVAALFGAQLAVVGTLLGVDWWKNRNRKLRPAPRPGTYSATVRDSHLTIYTSGDELYDDMIAAIDAAERSVQLETYIWKGDAVGQRFLDAVNAAAARGVDVHVIYDGFGNLVVPSSFYRFSDQVHVLRIPAFLRPLWRGPLRHSGFNHSKVLVVDDRIGFVGGYNIGELYSTHWRDTHVREIGPAVWGLRNSFATLWNASRRREGDKLDWVAPTNWDPEVRVAANLPLQIVYPIRNSYLNGIERAEHHIWITTPYFIPDQQILDALMAAARRGVDVRVMVPKDSNHIVADWAARGFYGPMLEAGITILLYASTMIHAKTATIDGHWSTVGTANIDRLSLSFNYETNITIIDADFADEMEAVFKADTDECEVLSSPRWRDRHPMARVAEVILAPLRPFL